MCASTATPRRRRRAAWSATLASTVHAGLDPAAGAGSVPPRPRFDAIHACSPPDLFFLIGRFFRRRGVSFVYDQHDASPEILRAKRGATGADGLPERVVRLGRALHLPSGGRRHLPQRQLPPLALTRGRKSPEDVFVVRSAPRLGSSRRRRSPASTAAATAIWSAISASWASRTASTCSCAPSVSSSTRATTSCCTWPATASPTPGSRHWCAESGWRSSLMAGYQTNEEFTPPRLRTDVCVAPDPPGPVQRHLDHEQDRRVHGHR